jgi:PAS domain-containing protein
MIMKVRHATEPQPTEHESRQKKVGWSGAQRLIDGGNWEWNLVSRKYSWCDEMYRIFKLTPEAFPPRTGTFFNCVHPADRDKVVKAFGKALVGEQPFNIDHRIVWPDGSVRFVHAEAAVTFDEANRPIRMLGTIRDITQLQQGAESS